MRLKTLLLSALFPTMAVAAPSFSSDDGVGIAQGDAMNTAQAWSVVKDAGDLIGRGGLPLTIEEQSLWSAWRAGRIQGLPVLAWGDGAVIYPLGLQVPVLQTSPGNFSTIVLNRKAVPSGFLGAPATQWIVKTMVAGDHAVIAISPRFPGLKSNLQILATGPHGHLLTYTVGLVSGVHRYTPQLSFYRDQERAAVVPLLPTSPDSRTVRGGTDLRLQKDASSHPAIVATKLSVNWTQQCATGDCQTMMPLTASSSPTQTFVHFDKPLQSAPLVLPENRAGKSWYASSRLVDHGKTLVVNADPWRLDLMVIGAKKQITEVRLTHGETKEDHQ
ncbi:hypothetical protein HHS34_005490 [Acidithiobacillus montserratensis]|uniref:Uncharacterized protein n=1 Tax=Acidithiobacillus montserratensis TaxID=2729135 RepID=A0ACD5HJG1_9PROT|nr:hypothetical protein [Acidithiobacillus montserratensis]MBU2749213.1 hypothetical protein [Acidithiobacillus montserratensis]